MSKILNGTRVFLRPLEPTDVDILYSWENDPANWHVSQTLVPFSREIIRQFVLNASDLFSDKQVRFMICEAKTQNPVGAVDLFDFDFQNRRVGVGILIANDKDRKMGFAMDAISIILNYCREILMLHQVYCNILESNHPSLGLFKKLGFVEAGKLKDWFRKGNQYEDQLVLQYIFAT